MYKLNQKEMKEKLKQKCINQYKKAIKKIDENDIWLIENTVNIVVDEMSKTEGRKSKCAN